MIRCLFSCNSLNSIDHKKKAVKEGRKKGRREKETAVEETGWKEEGEQQEWKGTESV